LPLLISKSKSCIKVHLTYTVIQQRIDGQVSKIDIQPGQLVQPGQSFYIINTNCLVLQTSKKHN
jgi:multidrug resistance efflux pump